MAGFSGARPLGTLAVLLGLRCWPFRARRRSSNDRRSPSARCSTPAQPAETERLLDAIQAEIGELLRRDYDVRFPDSKHRVSDWTAAGIRRELDALLADPEVDMVLVIGPVSTAALCCYDELPKPVFAPLGIDGEALGLPAGGRHQRGPEPELPQQPRRLLPRPGDVRRARRLRRRLRPDRPGDLRGARGTVRAQPGGAEAAGDHAPSRCRSWSPPSRR